MKAKDKAKELVYKFYDEIKYMERAKQCALIAVDEIIQEIERINEYEYTPSTDYWQEVKQAIKGGEQ